MPRARRYIWQEPKAQPCPAGQCRPIHPVPYTGLRTCRFCGWRYM